MTMYSFLRGAIWRLRRYPGPRIGAFLQRSQHWSREELISYRDARIRDLIIHCYDNVPYYRRIMEEARLTPNDVQHADDLRKLPLLTKDLIRANAADLTARNVPEGRVAWTRTGGTTGEPMRIAKDLMCSVWENMCYQRGLEWGGLLAHDARISLFGGSLGIDQSRRTTRLGNWLRGEVFLPAFELTADTAPKFFDMIRRSRARYALGYTSALFRLATLAERFARDVSFDAVFPTAEILLPEWEHTIRQRFRCDVLPYYGCGELNSIGFTPRGERSYCIPEEQCLIELLQDDGSTTRQGDGRFVITSLVNFAMPILRYVNGDAGRIGYTPGKNPYSRIDRLDGRYNSFLITDTGELISGAIGAHLFRHLTGSVHSYRIIQDDPLHISVKILPIDARFSDADAELVRSLLVRHLGSKMRVSIERVTSLPTPPSGKTVFVINHCL